MELKRTVVGVVGGGVVGAATAQSYRKYAAEVRVYDLRRERRTHGLEAVLEGDVVFLCLPTPQRKDGLACDLGVVDDLCATLSRTLPDGLYVLKSTVPVGTTRRLREHYALPRLVHSPEFLTARTAEEDAHAPRANVIGLPAPLTGYDGTDLYDLYRQRFPEVPLNVMTSDESEAVKLAMNSFFAVKVAWWNELHEYCTAAGLDWQTVRGAVLADGRIHPLHTEVPGPDGLFGFGGTCLPKDLANFATCLLKGGGDPTVCLAAHNRNFKDRGRKA